MLPSRADAIVVLGRGIDHDGSLPKLAKQRVERAAELSAWQTAPRIIFSGRCSLMTEVIPAVTEAGAMAEYAVVLGLPREALHVEEQSRDTIGNAYFVLRDYLEPNDWTSIRVVTSDFHIQRTAWVFQKVFGVGYDISFSPAPSELDHSTIAARAGGGGHHHVPDGMVAGRPRRRSRCARAGDHHRASRLCGQSARHEGRDTVAHRGIVAQPSW
jgi:uncharacterized SAM-binding protein YcdF (DUF218 family)